MKPDQLLTTFLYTSFILLFLGITACNTQKTKDNKNNLDSLIVIHQAEILNYQDEMNSEFADSNQSPLDSTDLKLFTSLHFFEPDYNYRVEAKFIKAENEKHFKMPTTTDRMPEYIKYGELHFNVSGAELQLSVYQNVELVKKEEYKDYLFIPFTDLTNGFETYGGGRYLDIRYSNEQIFVLDFNKAYNPYCAYSGRWSCPIPPEENHLNIEINAGVKSFH